MLLIKLNFFYFLFCIGVDDDDNNIWIMMIYGISDEKEWVFENFGFCLGVLCWVCECVEVVEILGFCFIFVIVLGGI